ncbi:MAG: hypothetical protein ACFFEK_09695 [Candidatus Thorarchaeota archaeon]
MQGMDIIDAIIPGAPGILLGFILGYILGGTSSLSVKQRVGLGFIISLFGGMITGLLFLSPPLNTLITFEGNTFEFLLFLILSYFGGYTLGAGSNWAPSPEKPPERHIIYEPDDEEEYDKEIEETMGSDFKANNS